MNIYEAIRSNDMKEVQECINNGADINTRNSDEWTPLYSACCVGRCDIALLLLKNGAVVNVKGGSYNATPLHYACLDGHYDIVSLLLENGADVNARTAYGWIPLYSAFSGDYYDIAHLLLFLSKGEDIKSISFNSFWRVI